MSLKNNIIFLLILVATSLTVWVNIAYASDLVRFKFQVKPQQQDFCLTNTASTSDDLGETNNANAITQVGTPTQDCQSVGGTRPSGFPVSGTFSTYWCEYVQVGSFVEACHPGYDIMDNDSIEADASINGQKVFATHSGIVSEVSYGGCGGAIGVKSKDNNNTYMTRYIHLKDDVVTRWRIGQQVQAGQFLSRTYPGALGGCSSGEHLHFETRKTAVDVDISSGPCPRGVRGVPSSVFPCVDPQEFTGPADLNVTAGQGAQGWSPEVVTP